MAKCIVYWRAFNGNRRLLVAWQMSDWRPVQASASIDVDSIDDFVPWLCSCIRWMRNSVLAGRGKKETAVRCEG